MSVPHKLRSIPLWEPQWNEQALRKRHATEERSFERGFRMKAFSDDEKSFPSYERCRIPGVSLGEIQRGGWPKVMGVDLAGRKRPGNFVVTVAVDPASRRRYVIDARRGSWRSTETCEVLEELNGIYRPVVVMVEDNGYQAALVDWIQARKGQGGDLWMKVEATTTTGETKIDPELGLPSLEVEFRNQGWVFPLSEWEGFNKEEPGPKGAWATLDYELRHHPMAATSDGAMALWFCRQGIERYLGGAYGAGAAPIGDIKAR